MPRVAGIVGHVFFFLVFAVARFLGVRSILIPAPLLLWAFYQTSPFHIVLCMCRRIFFPDIFVRRGRLGVSMFRRVWV